MLVQTSFDSHRDSGKGFGPHITVINHDGADRPQGLLGPPLGASGRAGSSGGSSLVMGTPSPRQLSRQGSSMESTAIVPIHHHTLECSATGRGLHQPTTHSKVRPVQYIMTRVNRQLTLHCFFSREALRPRRSATSTAAPCIRRLRQQPQRQLCTNLRPRPLRQCSLNRLEASRPPAAGLGPMASVHFLKVLTFDSLMLKWTEELLKLTRQALPHLQRLPTIKLPRQRPPVRWPQLLQRRLPQAASNAEPLWRPWPLP